MCVCVCGWGADKGVNEAVNVCKDEDNVALPSLSLSLSLSFSQGDGLNTEVRVQGRAKKTLLSSVTHVLPGLMGCALAA